MSEDAEATWPILGPYRDHPDGEEFYFRNPDEVIAWVSPQIETMNPLFQQAIQNDTDHLRNLSQYWQNHLAGISLAANDAKKTGWPASIQWGRVRAFLSDLGEVSIAGVFVSVRDPRIQTIIGELRGHHSAAIYMAILLELGISTPLVPAFNSYVGVGNAAIVTWKASARLANRTAERFVATAQLSAERAEEAADKTDALHRSVDTLHDTVKAACARAEASANALNDITAAFDEKAKAGIEKVAKLQAALDETIRLSSAEAYWTARARKAALVEWAFIAVFTGVVGYGVHLGIANWAAILTFINDLDINRAPFTIAVLVVLPSIVLLMLLRFLLRQQQRYAQIADDAAFRRTLLITHLSLVADGEVPPATDRVLVLQALFRSLTPSAEAEAAPATLLEALLKQVQPPGGRP